MRFAHDTRVLTGPCPRCRRQHRASCTPTPQDGLLREVYRTALDAQIDGLSSQIAFSAIFAMGPLISLSLMVLRALPAPAVRKSLNRLLDVYVPEATRPFVEGLSRRIMHDGSPVLLAVSVVGLLWSVSSGTSAVITALENIGCPTRADFFHRRLRAVILGAVGAVGLAFAAVAVTLGPGVVGFLARVFRVHVPALQLLSVGWIRLPLAGLSFAVVGGLFFAFGTVRRPAGRAVVEGAALTGCMAALVSAALSAYLTFAPRLGGGYGAATSFLGVLLWLYLLGLATLLGATVTHVRDVRLRAFRNTVAPGADVPDGSVRRRLVHRHVVLHALRMGALHRRRHGTST